MRVPAAAALLLQGGAGVGSSPWDLILGATLPTKVILVVLAAFSVVSWILIFWKWSEFRQIEERGDRFVEVMEGSAGLDDIHARLSRLEDSPYRRTFREGVEFFGELRGPTEAAGAAARSGGGGRSGGEAPSARGLHSGGLTPAQLDALRLVLNKGLAEERDDLGHGLSWLAIIGSVSPLLGLLGTVVGVMNSFINITAQGSASIAAVAPGIAEALVSTVVGLAVAIPAVIAYNHYAAKLGLFASELEGFASEFVGTLAREGRV